MKRSNPIGPDNQALTPATAESAVRRQRNNRWRLSRLIATAGGETAKPRRGQLLLESLEKRQMLAGDSDLLFTDGNDAVNVSVPSDQATNSLASQSLPVNSVAEGEPEPDLVQFAKDLAAVGAEFFGAYWCPACTAQKELFEDGGDDLPFIEVTNPDRTLNSTGVAEGITEFPTWKFGTTTVTGVQTLAELSTLTGVPIPQSEQPTFATIGNQTVRIGSPLHIPVDAYDPNGGPLTVTVSVEDPSLVEATVLTGNRSMRIDMNGYGDMVFELFEQRAPRPTGRIIDLAQSGFYDDNPQTSEFDGIIFHRVVDNFVLQAGDPTATGTGGSSLGDFDDQFHPDLQHNRSGVLSYAKSGDDTNDSQFFITEPPTRSLDFNHSIFGQLVEGDENREAISETEVIDPNSNPPNHRPTRDIQISNVEIFTDTENSVVMLKALGNTPGSTNVTFTVTDQDNNSHSETVQVSTIADTATSAANSENSQPFLNPITTPSPTTTNTNATLQLSSVDIEGDAVTYTAQAVSNAANATVSVDSVSGLVTVTPDTDFTGTVDVLVGVRRAQPNAFQTNDRDTQLVTFEFEGEQVVPAPTSVDLQTASDTGSSNIDNVTRASTMSFSVTGVTSGATVELVNTDSNTVVGTGVATGTSIVITTNNIGALPDGSYPIAARQRIGGETSDVSPSITVVYDTTAPESVIASAATTANLARLYETDLISTEEGSGLVYTLTAAPTGATIDSTTGEIEWTPVESQLGDNSFTLQLTDPAGNSRSETFTVAVAGEPLAEIQIELTDLQGNPISSVSVGDTFLLNMIAIDARLFNQPGVFAAYADILFDSSILRPEPGSQIEFSDDFTVERKGTFSSGLIDELGGVSNELAATNERENLIATVRMEALASGTVNIRSEPADESDSDVLLFFEDNRIPADTVFYGDATLAVGQSFTVGADTFTVTEDSAATTLDVLANDQVISGSGSLSVVSVTQPTAGGSVTLDNGVVRFTPTADFHGTATFTYRVSDSGGVQEDGDVTVTVTAVNDPPTAVNDSFDVDQDSSGTTLDLVGNDLTTPDNNETLTITSVGTPSQGGTVTIASDGLSVNYIPAGSFTGVETFSYTVSDGSLSDSGEVTVTVAPADNPPTANNDAFEITEDANQAAFDILANDTRDVDNQTFSLSSIGTPSNGGNASISNDGTELLYQPAADFSGTETVTYTIRDTGGGLAVGTVTFTVTNVNDAPPVENANVTITRGSGESSIYELSDLPDNPDAGETLTFSNINSPTSAGGSVRISGDSNSLLYTPPSATFTGTDSFTYTVADGSGLTATATIAITVADFTERDIILNLSDELIRHQIDGIILKGTNALGDAVEVPLTYSEDGARFGDVLPGDYSVEIPAIPFLQNASAPTQIAVSSAPNDGDTTVETSIGRLRPEYISIRDWLGSAPRRNLLVAIAPGESSSLMVLSPSADTIDAPQVELDAAGNTLTIRGSRTETDPVGTTDVETTLPTASDARVQLRGEVDGMRLYKISVDDDVTFTPNTALSTASAEGEAFSELVLGDIQAEGESAAAAAVSRTDLFVPVGEPATRSDATVLPLADGELWVGDQTGSKRVVDTSLPVDAALRNVSELSLESATTDQIANNSVLDHALVDEALGGDLNESPEVP